MSPLAATRTTLVLGVALVVFRVPFLLAGHIQEDAYITWRVARVLVENGTYGFNPGETVSASSSHAYVAFCALIRAAAGRWFVPVVLVLNALLLVAGTWRLASVFSDDPRQRRLAWVMVSVLPVALQTSYSGMETSLLIFLVASLVADYADHARPTWIGLAAAAVLPWVRPEGFVWPLISAIGFGTKHRSFLVRTLLITAASTAAVCAFNVLMFGSIVNQTVVAKSLAYHAAFGVSATLVNLKSVFLGNAAANVPGLFVPIYSRYLVALGPIALAAVGGASFYWVWRASGNRDQQAVFLVLTSLAFGPPVAYAVGGVIFPWYLWPSRLIGSALLVGAALDLSRRSRPAIAASTVWALSFALALMAVGEWAFAFHWGDREARFRTDIGLAIRDASTPGDTLLLEPAGYIPYFAGIHTDDEVGLASPAVTDYRKRFGAAWWTHFVRDHRPTFLVERPNMLEYWTLNGHHLTADEQDWFETNYRLIRTFSYDPGSRYRNPLLLRLLRTVPLPEDFLLYRRLGD